MCCWWLLVCCWCLGVGLLVRVCCLLFVDGCRLLGVWCVVRCLLIVVCRVLFVDCCLLGVGVCWLCVVC